MHTKCLQHRSPTQTRHHRISLKAMFVETFLHVSRIHLTCVTSSVETLEQPPDLPLLAKVLWWHHVDHLAHFPMEERHRNVKQSNDRRRICSLGLVTRCPTQNQSHEFQKAGVPQTCQILVSPVLTSVAHNRHCIAGLFGPFRVSTPFYRFSCLVSLASLIRRPPFEFIKLSHLFGSSLSHFF